MKILDKELDSAAESRKEYSQLASRVLDDLSKGLSDPNLSEEEKSKIRTQEIGAAALGGNFNVKLPKKS